MGPEERQSDDPVQRLLAPHRESMSGAGARREHVDDETLGRHASADLPAESALEVAKHLAICDGDCPDRLRSHAASVQTTREALYPETDPVSAVGRRVEPPPPPVDEAAARRVSERIHPGKTIRSFACRDVLWEMFEQLSRELECSVDYLLNESMKHYARHRAYAGRTPPPGTVDLRPSNAPPSGARPSSPASTPVPSTSRSVGTPPAFGSMPPETPGSIAPPQASASMGTPQTPASAGAPPTPGSIGAPPPPGPMGAPYAPGPFGAPPMPGSFAPPAGSPSRPSGPPPLPAGGMGAPHAPASRSSGPPPLPPLSVRPTAPAPPPAPPLPTGIGMPPQPGFGPPGYSPPPPPPMQHHQGRIGSTPPPPIPQGPRGLPPPPIHAMPQTPPPPPLMQSPMQPPMAAPMPPHMVGPYPGVAPGRAAGGAMPPLSAFYAGNRHPVTKDRFIIGRGKNTTDLTVRDPNISRQHAMIEFSEGQYYMVDLGSTNGVEYMGQRISRKAIAEGDLFVVCGHEIRFTYR